MAAAAVELPDSSGAGTNEEVALAGRVELVGPGLLRLALGEAEVERESETLADDELAVGEPF